MEGVDILERIIKEEGSCCWAKPSICSKCPLGRLARVDSVNYMSCVESLGVDGLSEEEADTRYKEAAINKLAELKINEMIESD